MPNFEKLFIESKAQPINYNGTTLLLADKFPVSNEDVLLVSIERVNSTLRQGVTIDITGHCEIGGEVYKQGKGIRILFWQDIPIKPIKVFTNKNFVWIYNIWEMISYQPFTNEVGKTIQKEYRSEDYGHNGSAMIVEEIENGRRYRCNDCHPDENFDDIVFTVQRIQK